MSKAIDPSRRRLVGISPEVLLGLLLTFHDPARRDCITATGLPADAELFRTYYDPANDVIYLSVLSASFEPVPEDAEETPMLNVIFTREDRP